MKRQPNHQIINDAEGKPAFVVIPYDEYLEFFGVPEEASAKALPRITMQRRSVDDETEEICFTVPTGKMNDFEKQLLEFLRKEKLDFCFKHSESE
ncbi:hypothetical protein [Maridesulfovibrio bastinii]|uniref:hypothetical protein n=1 Tax=Maridesulfovibrio bastinii TaxID=47157 RepID=UPI000488CF4C|nr:hypothetical protein [Maridesulfovibrio bastinii]